MFSRNLYFTLFRIIAPSTSVSLTSKWNFLITYTLYLRSCQIKRATKYYAFQCSSFPYCLFHLSSSILLFSCSFSLSFHPHSVLSSMFTLSLIHPSIHPWFCLVTYPPSLSPFLPTFLPSFPWSVLHQQNILLIDWAGVWAGSCLML